MILVIDNYDSFVYNLVRYLEELGQETRTVRNGAITPREVRDLAPGAVVLSPGPCDPGRAGVCVPLVRELGGHVPILGVCLGHQAIAAALGGRVVRSGEPRHGVASEIRHDGRGVFRALPDPFLAGRYHSLVVDPGALPRELAVSAVARDSSGETIMAIRHREHLTVGVQFHPESVLTPRGHQILENFLGLAGLPVSKNLEREPAILATEVR